MMTRQQRRFEDRKLRKLKLVPCDVKMTASSGLGTILEIFDKTDLAYIVILGRQFFVKSA
jgi:hypothetical protein